jgi:Mn-dependent DtxR family transcriptional regulator
MKESGENYLETLLLLNEKMDNKVRAVDLAKELSYSKPSVSRALNILKNNGFLSIDTSGYIHLTETGQETAEMIYERHKTLTDLFLKLAGVSAEIAEKDACRIEHVISSETFLGLKTYLENLQSKEQDTNKI